ncbi:MAG: pitrilysin family protein [bacterium]|nr:pitrilysin family protein [bacterium]
MIKNVIKSDVLGEQYVYAKHESGLEIYICEKPEFSSAYAVFGTKYGSVDTRFSIDKGEPIEVPAGIAHFLEHKLFESEDGDAFSKYSKTGAMANAYTSFDRTCYLFSCCDRFDENLDILLGFVGSPYFTKQTVEKEQGIIGQEIKMYDDSPAWRVLFDLLKIMYHNHPVRVDIAGTVDSISKITDKLLFDCYNAFYNPSNMFICIAGAVDADVVLKKVCEAIKEYKSVDIERLSPNEPDSVVKNYCESRMTVSMPLFNIGIKETVKAERVKQFDIIVRNILLECIVGKSSDLYNMLLEQKLINNEFSTEYFYGCGYSAMLFCGESSDPQRVLDLIKQEIARLQNVGVDPELFEGARRKLYGQQIRQWNNPEDIVSVMVDSTVIGGRVFDAVELFLRVTQQDVNECVRNIRQENIAMSVINPLNS